MPGRADVAAPRAIRTLGILTLAYILAFVDRQILNLLVEPIKHDLMLTDVEVSLLQGLSFAVVLSVCGLPLGRLLDRGRRTRLLAGGIALWSLATAACGLAHGYLALLVARMGVGLGEAAMTPAAYSLIGDLFAGRRQGAATATYALGVYIGSGLALVVGGALVAAMPTTTSLPVIGRTHGWQLVFLAIGLAGLPVALLVGALDEPIRLDAEQDEASGASAWFRRRAWPLALVNLAVAAAAAAMYGFSAWAPALLHRRYGMAAAVAGPRLGLIVIAAGAAGTLVAGLFGDRCERRRPDGRLLVMIAGGAVALPFAALLATPADPSTALALIAPMVFGLTLVIGSGPATLQRVTPPRLRGLQHAIAVLCVNLVGLGLGPTAVALVTNHVFAEEARLGVALSLVLPLSLLVSIAAALTACAPYRRLLREAQQGFEASR